MIESGQRSIVVVNDSRLALGLVTEVLECRSLDRRVRSFAVRSLENAPGASP